MVIQVLRWMMTPMAAISDAVSVLPVIYGYLAGSSNISSFTFFELPQSRVAAFWLLSVTTYVFVVLHSYTTVTLTCMPTDNLTVAEKILCVLALLAVVGGLVYAVSTLGSGYLILAETAIKTSLSSLRWHWSKITLFNNRIYIFIHGWMASHSGFFGHPYLGKWSNLTNISQMGWFNHQLVMWVSRWCIWMAIRFQVVLFRHITPIRCSTPNERNLFFKRTTREASRGAFGASWFWDFETKCLCEFTAHCTCKFTSHPKEGGGFYNHLGGGNSNIFYVHPYPILTEKNQMGLRAGLT